MIATLTFAGKWLEDDFVNDAYGRMQTHAQPQLPKAQSQQAPAGRTALAGAPALVRSGSSNASSASRMPKPPSGPRPQEVFARPLVPQAPQSRPDSRTGSDFRRRARNGVGNSTGTSPDTGGRPASSSNPAPPRDVMDPLPLPPPTHGQRAVTNNNTHVAVRPVPVRAAHAESILEDWDD